MSEATPTPAPVFHCQVCEREIKAKKGAIAHHGYRRPGGGWQTASCIGAKHAPYEVSCDVLPRAIAAVESYLAARREFLKTLVEAPPATLTVPSRRLCGGPPVTYERPADFEADPKRHGATIPNTYASAWAGLYYGAQGDVRMTAPELERLKKRLADWKAPG